MMAWTYREPGMQSRLPRGIPAASLKQQVAQGDRVVVGRLPRGIPAASLKPCNNHCPLGYGVGLPRGIPAASLKHDDRQSYGSGRGRLPRGIPAASLKLRVIEADHEQRVASSAGNTRGLIEARCRAPCPPSMDASSAGNTRGLIEASGGKRPPTGRSLPRGIPAASLKRLPLQPPPPPPRVFRGEYPRPH